MNDDYTTTAFAALVKAARTERDFADWLTHLLAGVGASLGGAEYLTIGRPGSWESDYLHRWMVSAGMEQAEVVEDYKAQWADEHSKLAAQIATETSSRAAAAASDLQQLPDTDDAATRRADLIDTLVSEDIDMRLIEAISGHTRRDLAAEWARVVTDRATTAIDQINGDQVDELPDLDFSTWEDTDQAFHRVDYDTVTLELLELSDRFDEACDAWNARRDAEEEEEG